MNYFEKPGSLKLLQDLLKSAQEDSSDSDPDDRVPGSNIKISTPSSSKLPEPSNSECSSKAALDPDRTQLSRNSSRNVPQSLSEWEEQDALLNETELEDRLLPEYRIVYKQSVRPEDIYLHMTNKTPATSSCEEMCVEILLPKETVTIDQMTLDVSSDEIDLKTPMYRLKLPLVQQIDPDRGNASWNDNEKTLRLTLRMKREYDFINF